MLTTQYVDDLNHEIYDHEELATMMAHECGLPQLPYMARAFRALIAEGFDPLLLHQAICRTAMAPRPSWAYLEGILRNCRLSGIYDVAHFLGKRHDDYFDKLMEESPAIYMLEEERRRQRGKKA